jgi:hypothetical protein
MTAQQDWRKARDAKIVEMSRGGMLPPEIGPAVHLSINGVRLVLEREFPEFPRGRKGSGWWHKEGRLETLRRMFGEGARTTLIAKTLKCPKGRVGKMLSRLGLHYRDLDQREKARRVQSIPQPTSIRS